MRLRTIFRNVLSNWVGYLIATIAGFLVSPVIVNRLGDAGYGLWTLIMSLTGSMGLLDLGVRSSVGRFVARYISLNDPKGVSRTVSTALLVLLASAAMALGATAILYTRLDKFNIDPSYAHQAGWALLIAGVSIAMALPAGAFGAILFAMERNDITSAVSVAGSLVRSGLVVWALQSGHGVIALALIALAVSSAEFTTWVLCARRFYPQLRLFESRPEFPAFKELFSFSVYRFIWIVANQIVFYSDAVVISLYVNASAISAFAIAASLITYGRTLVSLATDPLSPSATRMDCAGDRSGLQGLLVFGTQLSLCIAIPLCLGYVFLGRQFLALWMGPAHIGSAVFLTILALSQFVSLSQYTSALILVSMARHRMLAYIVLGEGVANLALSVYLVQTMGVVGVAWGTVIPQVVSTAIVLPLYTLRTLGMSPWNYLRAAFVRPVLCGVPVAGLCYLLSERFHTVSWAFFALEGVAVAGSYLLLMHLTGVSRQMLSWPRPAVVSEG